MEEPIERRSNRSRKPIVHFDDLIAQSSGPSKPSVAPKAPAKPTKPATKPTAKPTAQPTAPTTKPTIKPEHSVEPKPFIEPKRSIKRSTKASTKTSTKAFTKASTKAPTLNPIEELCSQTETLDIKTKKETKAEEVVHLTKLNLKGVIEKAKPITDVHFGECLGAKKCQGAKGPIVASEGIEKTLEYEGRN